MAKSVVSKHAKICPANKFSFMSGCMSWLKIVNIIGALAIIITIILVYMTYNGNVRKDSSRNNINHNNNHNDNSKAHQNQSNQSNQPNHVKFNNIKFNNIKFNNRGDGNGDGDGDGDNDNDNNKITFSKSPEEFAGFAGFDYTESPSENTGTPQSGRIQYDINLNIRDANPNVPNNNVLSYAQYQADKDIERIINPILPPERSYQNSYGLPINIPSRGPTGAFEQIGFLSQTYNGGSGRSIHSSPDSSPDSNPESSHDSNPDNNKILPLFGRPIFFGSKNWSYYTFSDKYQSVKMPLVRNHQKCDQNLGCQELYQGDKVHVPPYKGDFTVSLYDIDAPRYIPYVY